MGVNGGYLSSKITRHVKSVSNMRQHHCHCVENATSLLHITSSKQSQINQKTLGIFMIIFKALSASHVFYCVAIASIMVSLEFQTFDGAQNIAKEQRE